MKWKRAVCMWQPFPSHDITSGIKLVCTLGLSTARKRFNVNAVMASYSLEMGYPGKPKWPPCPTSSTTTPPSPPPPGTKRWHQYLATIHQATSDIRKWHNKMPGNRHNIFIACKGNKRQTPTFVFLQVLDDILLLESRCLGSSLGIAQTKRNRHWLRAKHSILYPLTQALKQITCTIEWILIFDRQCLKKETVYMDITAFCLESCCLMVIVQQLNTMNTASSKPPLEWEMWWIYHKSCCLCYCLIA